MSEDRRERRFFPRLTLTNRLLVAGFVFTTLIVASIGGYLLFSRSSEGRTTALVNATNRAAIARQLLGAVVSTPAQSAARTLAANGDVKTALQSNDLGAIASLLGHSQLALFADTNLVVMKQTETGLVVVFTTECGGGTHDLPAPMTYAQVTSCESSAIVPHAQTTLRSVQVVAAAGHPPAGSLLEGTEFLGSGMTYPAYDVASPVVDASGSVLGVVVYSTPLSDALTRYIGVIGFNPVIIPAAARQVIRVGAAQTDVATTPPLLEQHLQQTSRTFTAATDVQAVYPVAGVTVAGSFVELRDAGSKSVAAYLGVEVPLSAYEGNTKGLVSNVIGLGITAILLMFLFILLFVNRFVRKPIRRVEKGVARIAGGDYATPIAVSSDDELGRMTKGVNSMREQIAGYVDHLAESVGQLKAVSKALTTTTTGVDGLNTAVVQAAQAIAGAGSAAVVTQEDAEHNLPPMGRVRSVFAMDYKEKRVGVLTVDTDKPLSVPDLQALSALANNAAVALENARLFEAEKETVEKLREIDRIKSDFLTTAQHELRTPILAIMGQLDLITVGWEQWDDTMKLGMVKDIDASTRQMDVLVATMVDYTLLTSDSATIKRTAVEVEPVVQKVLADLAAQRREGIVVKVRMDIAPGVSVDADRQRFTQMMHAILDNAVKFTEPGGTIDVRCRTTEGLCLLSVSDTGVGMGDEAIQKAFEPFYQEDNSKTRRFGGMGMGLALAKKVCELHESEIQLTSTPGRGTSVNLRWKAVSPATPVPAAAGSGFHITV